MKEMLIKKMNKKGFTLAELLIVVAIIAVLVAISIPIFSSQLEKSREAVDAANIRAAYAECQTAILTDGDITNVSASSKEITLKQQTADWQTKFDFPAQTDAFVITGTPSAGGKATFTYDKATGVLTCTLS